MSCKYTEFLAGLSDQQVRALSHQAGIAGAMTYPVAKLYNLLLDSDEAIEIHEEVFGG